MKMTIIERHETEKEWPTVLMGLALASWMSALVLFGFPASAQNDPSLGEVARQTRNERILNKQEAAPTVSGAQRLAAELNQEQEEAGNVPAGFQSYSAEGYRVSVPAPYSVEGRDDTGC